MDSRDKLLDLMENLLYTMGYSNYYGIIQMRINDLSDVQCDKIVNKIAQQTKTW